MNAWLGKAGRNLRDHLGWAASLFLVGLGAKLWLIHRFGSPFPFLDQWEVEAADLYIPWFAGHLSLADLFRAHNEHRLFFTRLYSLGLLLLNGQWDCQLQMVVNAIIHSATTAGFGWVLASMLGRKYWRLIWPLLALYLACPFAWENTLWGMENQFYFLLIFSLLCIWLLALHEPLSRLWWLGAIVAVAALFTAASGFLAVVAVLCLSVLELHGSSDWRRQLPTWMLCALIAVAGLLLKGNVPGAAHIMAARSIGDFLQTLGKNLAWPWVTMPLFALCNLFPISLLLWRRWRERAPASRAEKLVLGIAAWVFLQSLATAYARGAHGAAPESRYMDCLALLVIVDALSIALLLTRSSELVVHSRFCRIGFAVCALLWLIGLGLLSSFDLRIALPLRAAQQQNQLANTLAFLASDDEQLFTHKQSADVPLPDTTRLAAILRNPDIRRILPAGARTPLKVLPANGGDHGFVLNGCASTNLMSPVEPCWGSYSGPAQKPQAKFESLPVPKSTLPFLEIPVAGDLGAPGLSLELVDLTTGKSIAVKPPLNSQGEWVNVDVPAPVGDFKIVAKDESANQWFAFRSPRELGRLSFWATKTATAWKYFLLAGFGVFLLNASLLVRRQPDSLNKGDTSRAAS